MISHPGQSRPVRASTPSIIAAQRRMIRARHCHTRAYILAADVDPTFATCELKELLRLFLAEEMKVGPISLPVNSLRNIDAELIEPVDLGL